MKLIYDGCTEVGSVREINEDSILMCASDDAALFLVADGIGGKEHGEIVSNMLRERYFQWWINSFLPSSSRMSFQKALEEIKEILLGANRESILRFGEWNAGSTIALLFLFGENCVYLSSGDSRIYRMRGVSIRQMTRDDVFENLSKERAARYDVSSAGKLVGAVGINHNLDFSIRTDVIRRGDRYFLCSDGVYRFVSPRRLRRHLCYQSLFSSPKDIVKQLSKDVERNGAGDNYSMILIKTW